ncbi:MAG: YeeE/YedE thiosulfate transporter family protein [Paracoccaceae bacterium]|nr:YeeE/YedE thiosulfate transporter family protein [Paracoccaceae bacterium]
MTLAIALLMGLILGFSAHRAGICTVKAVAEVLTSRRAYFLISFAKTGLWVIAVTMLAGMFSVEAGFRHWPLTGFSVLGGVLFGMGAGVNRGCTFSTVSRLMDGNLNLAATVLGWPVGLWLGLQFWARIATPPVAVSAGPGPAFFSFLGLLVTLFVAWEICVLFLSLWRKAPLRRILGARNYTLTAAAALLGLSNGVLLLVSGPWSFTGTLLCGLDAGGLARCDDPALPWLILLAALTGMVISALQRGSFHWRLPRLHLVAQHGGAGVLMGFGAVLVPGGNDGLILFGLPSLSPHALPAYGGILLGILMVLLGMRFFGGSVPPIKCDGDICRSEI